MDMKRLISSFKVLTFINVKVICIFAFLISSFIIGIKYLNSIEHQRNELIHNIKQNEKEIINDEIANSKIIQLDNRMLSKTLDKKTNYKYIDEDITLMGRYGKKIINGSDSTELLEIIDNKKLVFLRINFFESQKVNLDKVKTTKKVIVINTNTKKGLFKTKINHDTIVTNYSDIDKNKYLKSYTKVTLYNATELNTLIRKSNDLSLRMKIILDYNTNKKMIQRLKDNEKIFDELKSNIRTYITTTLILIVLVLVLVYFLFMDFRKIQKKNNRSDTTLSLLINHIFNKP
jgi:hypothetical protein